MARTRAVLIWAGVIAVIAVPLVLAAYSPLLQWRRPVYIGAGVAGIVAMALVLLQPLLIGRYLPGLDGPKGRRAHRWVGGALVLAVGLHVAGLWVTSPPDVVDALTFTAPTAFSFFGVIAMWAVLATAALAGARRRLRPATWRSAHSLLALVIAGGSAAHALMIEGTMETVSKWALSALVLMVTGRVAWDLWSGARRLGNR